jgi:hypothetical protein
MELLLKVDKELVFFLKRTKKQPLIINLKKPTTVKDFLESTGIPHTEIKYIMVDKNPVTFRFLITKEVMIEAYSAITTLKLDSNSLQPPLPANIEFIIDAHLGKLTHYLRLCGFSALYNKKINASKIVKKISTQNNLILLTRNLNLLKNKKIIYGCFIRSPQPQMQLRQVIKRFRLQNKIKLFSRCPLCNNPLKVVSKNKIIDKLPPMIAKLHKDFFYCRNCQKPYWAGSHQKKIRELVENAVK